MGPQPRPAVRRILLAIDLTGASLDAIDHAIRMASDEHADLLLVSVIEPSGLRLPGGRSRRVDEERTRLETGVQQVVRRARSAGVAATYLIWQGDPADSIIEAAGSEGADVIVLGARRRTDLRRLLGGSVSAEVARRASCPVIIVPTGAASSTRL